MKKWIITILICVCIFPMTVQAAEGTEIVDAQNAILKQLDFSELNKTMSELFPNKKIYFADMLTGLLNGDLQFSFSLIKEFVFDQFSYEIRSSKSTIMQILLLVIVAAVFANFSEVFQTTQVANVSFTMLYMLLLTLCLNNFRVLIEAAAYNLERLIGFMEILAPIYFASVAFATGSATSIGFYQIVLIILFAVEILILSFLIPLTQIYLILKVLNEFSPEIKLSKFAELIQTIVSWSIKTLLASIIGLNVVQGLLAPAIDAVKRSVMTKGTEAIPIIGDAIGGTTEVIFGTAVLIRNGVGIIGMVVCLAICIVPLVQMAVSSLLYQLVAAVIQPISDKRLVNCVGSMADGSKLLLKIIFATCILFLITIAVVATTTGG